jgi:hypothetical protein
MTHSHVVSAREDSYVLQFAAFNHVPFYSPRIWHGMLPHEFGRLLGENRYKIDRSRWPMAICTFGANSVPAIWNPLQKWFYGRRAANLPLAADPIFVIGHWRSGTTLLHELLTLDDHYATPNTFQCFNPMSFLLTERWLRPVTAPLLPSRRPMDNMDMGYGVPQEDEFALMTLGLPTTYRRIAFPNSTPRHLDYLNMNGVPQPEIDRWKEGLDTFLRYLNYKYRKPLVLKSPPHTGRIHILKQMYPNARFIHITRHPLKFIPSTMHLWRALDHTNGFQIPKYEDLQEYVFLCFKRLYDGFHRDRSALSDRELTTVRFEDLILQPVDELRRVYERLDLGDFHLVEDKIRRRMNETKDYKRNKYELTGDLRRQILDRCRNYREQFGYSEDLAAA